VRASCENGHDREPMAMDQANDYFVCRRCGARLTPEAIDYMTPPEFRRASDPLAAVLQALADYEIEGVLGEGERLKIEYPRPSMDRR
jgi:hypothetical protein